MRVAALFSGGKDSTYAARLAEMQSHEVAFLVSMEPARPDSWMFHTINLNLTPLLAEAMGKRLVTAPTSGEKEKELKALRETLSTLDVDGVVTGALASTYQKSRVDAICQDLGLAHLSPLWGRDPKEVLWEEIAVGMEIILTAVAAAGLDEGWLGRRLDEKAARELGRLNERYRLNVCGEGGEYESLVLDAPWFRSRLKIIEATKEWDGSSGVYRVKRARLVPKLHKKG
jgi:predicted ATP pyrophosphatase (TIGR00289 family)